MKIQRKTQTRYHCDVCGTAHRAKAAAQRCDQRPLETLVAKIGDKVRILEPRQCSVKSGKAAKYTAEGTVETISPPLLPDDEYEIKWLKGRRERLGSHVFSYVVAYNCPRCNEPRKLAVFAPEFVVLPSP